MIWRHHFDFDDGGYLDLVINIPWLVVAILLTIEALLLIWKALSGK